MPEIERLFKTATWRVVGSILHKFWLTLYTFMLALSAVQHIHSFPIFNFQIQLQRLIHSKHCFFKKTFVFFFSFVAETHYLSNDITGFGIKAADFIRWSLPMTCFNYSTRIAETPGRRRQRPRMGIMLALLGLKAAPGWCLVVGKWNGQHGTQAGQETGKHLCPHFYRDLSVPQHPG